jgi:transposase
VHVYTGDTRHWQAEFDVPLPMKARDVLPAGHDSFMFIEMAGQFDMAAFDAFYRTDGRGHPPYDPRMMAALILYCRSKGITSSGKVAAACIDDLGARLITGNAKINRSTIQRFIDNHDAAIRGLLPQTLRLGHREGLVDLSVVAGDGTYLTANAAMNADADEAGLLHQIADLQQQLADAETDRWADDTGRQMSLFDGTGPGRPDQDQTGRTPRQIHALIVKLRARQTALNHLRARPGTEMTEWSERLERDRERVGKWTRRLTEENTVAQTKLDRRRQAEAAGKGYPGAKFDTADDYIRVRQARKALATATLRAETTAANPPTAGRVNITDPASRIMPGKHDGFDQRHNIQALACKTNSSSPSPRTTAPTTNKPSSA